MKRILTLAFVAIILCGCYETKEASESRSKTRLDRLTSSIHRFEFEGHTYLADKGGYNGGFCHDPDCECGSQK